MARTSIASFCVGLLLVLAPSAAPVHAQIVRGGDLVVANFRSPPAVFRVTPAGAVTQIPVAGLVGPSGVTISRAREILLADFDAGSVVRIDANGNTTPVGTGLGGPLRVAEERSGDVLVTSNTSRSVLRVDPQGNVTTAASGSPLVRPFDVALDENGDLLVVDDFARGLFRVTPGGSIITIHQGAPFLLPQGVALFRNGDYAVFDGRTDSVFRVDRASGQVGTFVTSAALGGNPCGIHESFDGGFFVSQSSAVSNRVVAIDGLGNVAGVASGAPFTNLEDVVRVPFVRGPNGLTTGPGSSFQIDLDVPAQAGNLYTLALSGGVFPGFPLPGGDPRGLTINPDPLFFGTILQNAPPVFVNWFAPLDGSGRATAGFDLQLFPPGSFAGLTLWMQGLVLDGSAPNSIGELTNALAFDFR